MKNFISCAVCALICSPVMAEDNCTTNTFGVTVCGTEAETVRARREAEERLNPPSFDKPAGANPVVQSSAPAAQVTSATPVAVKMTPVPAEDSGQLASVRAETRYADQGGTGAYEQPGSGGSVYSAYGPSAFLRGGYIFSGRASGTSGSVDAPSISVGYRSGVHRGDRTVTSVEGELLYLRDSEDALLLGVPIETTVWGLAGLVNLRWQYALTDHVAPFASVGAGPGYFRASVTSGATTVSDGDFTLAYTGRAGIEFPVSDGLSLETAYRYLGTTQSGTPGLHSAEVGLNFNF